MTHDLQPFRKPKSITATRRQEELVLSKSATRWTIKSEKMSDINTSALDAEPRDAQNTDTKLLRNEELSAPATTAAGRCSVLPTLSAYVCMITYVSCCCGC